MAAFDALTQTSDDAGHVARSIIKIAAVCRVLADASVAGQTRIAAMPQGDPPAPGLRTVTGGMPAAGGAGAAPGASGTAAGGGRSGSR